MTFPNSFSRRYARPLTAFLLTGLLHQAALAQNPDAAQPAALPALPATSLVKPGDRILLIGDSITGQSWMGPTAWGKLIERELGKLYADNPPQVIPLGGSGHTVGSWGNIAKTSREKTQTLDVKGFEVKENLDKHADIVVIMLGMNDLISPGVSASPASAEQWGARYADLVKTLKERTTPRVLAFATIPLATEDPDGPKNRVSRDLTQQLIKLAAAEGAVILPVHETMWSTLDLGRQYQPNYRLSGDLVHPGGTGHQAIARAMLAGLGEAGAAGNIQAETLAGMDKLRGVTPPVLSYRLKYEKTPVTQDSQTLKIRYTWRDKPGAPASNPAIKLNVPQGWTVSPAQLQGLAGEFTVTGKPERLHNLLTLESDAATGSVKTQIDVAPPWLVGTANIGRQGWNATNSAFEAGLGKLDADAALSRGEGFGKAVELKPGTALTWTRINPNVNYLGGDAEGNVDFSQATFYGVYEIGYGARFIQSPDDRILKVKLGSNTFADSGHLVLWANGQEIYSGHYNKDRNKILEIPLKKGWNPLTFRSNHLQWQWHFRLDTEPGQNTEDLRYSIVPPA